MSIRAFWNSLKEGIQGIIRHPLVTVASISTILLMLLLMSVFFIFSANARFIMKKVGQQPPIEVYMKLGCTQEQPIRSKNTTVFLRNRTITVSVRNLATVLRSLMILITIRICRTP